MAHLETVVFAGLDDVSESNSARQLIAANSVKEHRLAVASIPTIQFNASTAR